MANPEIEYVAAHDDDFDVLVELRIDAMRESLEALGRFDRKRSIERFRASFSSEKTFKVYLKGELVGFYMLNEYSDHLYLDHLYISPRSQSQGIGSVTMRRIIEISEDRELPLKLGALRGSRSNEFYSRHDFRITSEDAWDIYYVRDCSSAQSQ